MTRNQHRDRQRDLARLTAERQAITHLTDRARHGSLLPAEGDRLAALLHTPGDGVLDRYAATIRSAHSTRAELAAVKRQLAAAEERAEDALARVRALHQPANLGVRGVLCPHCSGWDGVRCRSLVTFWPCDTIRALDGPDTPPDTPGHTPDTTTNTTT